MLKKVSNDCWKDWGRKLFTVVGLQTPSDCMHTEIWCRTFQKAHSVNYVRAFGQLIGRLTAGTLQWSRIERDRSFWTSHAWDPYLDRVSSFYQFCADMCKDGLWTQSNDSRCRWKDNLLVKTSPEYTCSTVGTVLHGWSLKSTTHKHYLVNWHTASTYRYC